MWVEGLGDLSGHLVVVSGPSGSGKSTVVREVVETGGLHLQYSVSTTTRPARPGEQQGVDYHFVTPDAFRIACQRGEFLEWAEYNGNLYGTPAAPVYQSLKEGKSVILEIEVEGARQIRDSAPTALFVFVKTPTFRVLEQRLRARGTENDASMLQRLKTARKELAEAHWYDVQVVNDKFDWCVLEMIQVLKKNGCGG